MIGFRNPRLANNLARLKGDRLTLLRFRGDRRYNTRCLSLNPNDDDVRQPTYHI